MNPFEPDRLLRRTASPRLYPADEEVVLLEDPKPIVSCLEWRLGARYWQKYGVAPFYDGSVPYVINNSGWAPRAAAELVLAAGAAQRGTLIVIEVAAGSGLFTRQALDHLKKRCEQEQIDVYQRLIWICTDHSESTVASWQSRGQFTDHAERVIMTTANAEHIDLLAVPNGSVVGIIANYALDSLPADVVRRDGGQLHLQSCLLGTETDIHYRTGLDLAQARALATSDETEAIDPLLPLIDLIEVRASFQPGNVPHTQEALDCAQCDVAMVNTGALRFLEGALSHLQQGGFLLINDYGPTTVSAFDLHTFVHRFGGTVTCALNFPHLDHWLGQRGCTILRPEGDEHRTIHTRVAIVGESPNIAEAFQEWYNDTRYVNADRIGAWINSYLSSGQLSEAVDLFERHLRWCPSDWHKLAEAAQLLMQHFGHLPEALELATAACTLNPWSSTLVWNVYGSVLYSIGELERAEEAWQRAIDIYPKDPSTWLNLGYLYAARGQTLLALEALARGLAYDQKGALRTAILQKQNEILATQFHQQTATTDRFTRRHRTLADAIRPPTENS